MLKILHYYDKVHRKARVDIKMKTTVKIAICAIIVAFAMLGILISVKGTGCINGTKQLVQNICSTLIMFEEFYELEGLQYVVVDNKK